MINCTTSEQPIQARYVRDYLNGNTQNVSGHWVEIEVFDENGINVALNKTVTVTQGNWPTGYEDNLSRVTDGVKDVQYWLGSTNGGCEVQIDLGSVHSIKKIIAYHYWGDTRRYKDEHCRVSVDGNDWTTVFQISGNGAIETSSGITLYDFKNEKEMSNVKKGNSQNQSVMLGNKALWSSYGAFKFQAVGGSGFLKEQSPQKYTATEKCLLVVSHMRYNTTMSLNCTGTRLYFKDYNGSSRYICTYVYLMEQGDTISASSPSASGGDLSSIAFTTIKPFANFTFTDKGAVTQGGSLSFTADKECLLIETDVKYDYFDATRNYTGEVLQDTTYVYSSREIHTRIYHMKKGDTYSTTAGGTTGIQYPHRGHQLTQLTF